MFRRLSNTLPPDPTFPTDLDKLGYFVNENDLIRQKANPKQGYQYKINRSERVNDAYKEAMNACSRKIVLERLLELGLQELPLPLNVTRDTKHVPILVSKDLATKKHIIVLFPDRQNDPGILAYRVLGQEGINIGSVINLVKAILGQSSTTPDATLSQHIETPGLVIANPSQLIWYRRGARPVTDREWLCLPRPSAVHEAMRIDEVENRVEGNKNFREHIQYIFEHVLCTNDGEPVICCPEAKFSIIGQEYVGSEVMQYLTNNWLGWRNRINCVALINPQHELSELFSTFDLTAPGDIAEKEEIVNFIAKRTRAYRLSQRPLETLLTGRRKLGCNIYAAGEIYYEESCLIRCWPSVLDWIELCRVSDTFAEPAFDINLSDDEEAEPKIRSPRRNGRPLTEEEQGNVRFHGNMEVTETGTVAKAE
ncbi:hypothetical protein LTR64_007711 [Lithohypha guttulata]|uniref:uncharacterized protein n=1 Tax=Lithohypha guttulata TaxID=1690604 RepID=UPI002DE1C469|nr:hypothetical protein LTR51_007220 [Lithohypha guttulata]